jgi:hypothetical protein
MTPNKEQMYLLIVALDLAGVGPTKGVKPDFASMLDTTLDNYIFTPRGFSAISYGTNGPAGKNPAYPEKATTWKTLLKHGKKLLADYSTPIDADLYNRIGAEYNMMQNTRKNPNGYTDGGGFKHSTSKGAIQKGIKDSNSHLHSLLFNIMGQSQGDMGNAGLIRLGSIASQIGDWGLEGPPKVKKPAKEVAPVINEALMARSLPSSQPTDVLLPKKTYGTDMPIPPNYKTAVRKLKQKNWTNDKAYTISSEGASVFLHLFGEPEADKYYQMPDDPTQPENLSSVRTPDIIVKFTVGEMPVFSTFVGNTATTYPFSDENVTDIHIFWSNPADGPVYATECNIIHENGQGGLISIKGMEIQGIKKLNKMTLDEMRPDETTIPECLEFGLLPDGDGVKGSGLNEEDENFMENLKKLYDEGCGVYHFKPQAKLYASPDMYIPDKAKEEEYLLPPEVDFKSITAIGNDEYITFDLKIENPTFSTDNYTGRDSFNPRSTLVERLMFPGDEGLLAPIGITANGDEAECGKESPEGRVLKSIKVAKTGGIIFKIEMEFRDGSSCIFPDPESKVFSAVDKETGQLLKGKVEMQSINLDTGDIKDNYSNLVATRRGRNLNREHNIMAGDDNLTAAIAWRGGKQGETLKIIVPDPDNEGKSVIITIPLMEV